ncbi:MAG: hypothetical protein IKU94_09645 [Bacteroidaceae bacterium]|nr:hypothetical protein [Bacteroidaceae bacterium]
MYYISLMSYVKSFKELDRKRRCFSFAGAKVDTFHNMTKHTGNFFKEKRKNFKYTLYNIYMGAKRRQKSIAKGNTAEFQAQKAGAKICFQEHREKRDEKGLPHMANLFSSPCK